MKEFEELLRSRYVPKVCSNEFFNHCLESDSYNIINMALQAMKVTYNKGVTDSARHAEAKQGTFNPEIDKQSILKLLIP